MGKGPSNQAVPAIVNVFVELDRSPTELWQQLQLLLHQPSRQFCQLHPQCRYKRGHHHQERSLMQV